MNPARAGELWLEGIIAVKVKCLDSFSFWGAPILKILTVRQDSPKFNKQGGIHAAHDFKT
jgi:hypothetical protein